jgi:hypothetical protein
MESGEEILSLRGRTGIHVTSKGDEEPQKKQKYITYNDKNIYKVIIY